MADATNTDTTEITFESGYERMKKISTDLESPELTVAEMCDRYAEGKGLGQAMLGYLDEREGELREIDEGKNLPQFKIIATAKADAGVPADTDVPADTSDFGSPSAPAAVGADDDIPF